MSIDPSTSVTPDTPSEQELIDSFLSAYSTERDALERLRGYWEAFDESYIHYHGFNLPADYKEEGYKNPKQQKVHFLEMVSEKVLTVLEHMVEKRSLTALPEAEKKVLAKYFIPLMDGIISYDNKYLSYAQKMLRRVTNAHSVKLTCEFEQKNAAHQYAVRKFIELCDQANIPVNLSHRKIYAANPDSPSL